MPSQLCTAAEARCLHALHSQEHVNVLSVSPNVSDMSPNVSDMSPNVSDTLFIIVFPIPVATARCWHVGRTLVALPLKHAVDDGVLGTKLHVLTSLLLRCRGFCQRVVHPASAFFDRYHKQRGDKDIAVSPWQAHPVIGEVRELKFISPVSVRCLVVLPNLA